MSECKCSTCKRHIEIDALISKYDMDEGEKDFLNSLALKILELTTEVEMK